MKRSSTLFLRCVIIFIAVAVLSLCIFGIPWIVGAVLDYVSVFTYVRFGFVLAGVYLTAIFFFIALFHAFKLLTYIDKNVAFSEDSIRALRKIKTSAIGMSILYLCGMPIVYFLAQKEDAPGLMVIGLAFACAPFVVAVFTAVLQKLVRSAIDIKSENDFTV
ncbi:MAG TPA: DUF2975 domain-containing protein [Candidatus Paceibacterota bacterium]|nr:DUF2975 domain-containing protein [Candidatus Paceibacterota bacterium]